MNLFKKEDAVKEIDLKITNQIRGLALDIINNRGIGDDGVTLSSAPIFYTLFSKHLNINPNDSKYLNRDRLIISSTNMAPLLYATMYMAGYPYTEEDLKNYGFTDSLTPLNPKYNLDMGIEINTSFPAENFSTSIGFAIAEEYKRNYLKSKNLDLINYYTYVIINDKDLIDGLSYETINLIATLKLNKLIVIYDNNSGDNNDSYNTENIIERFKVSGWNTVEVNNSEDIIGIDKAICFAKDSDKPTLISIKTILGKFSKYENSDLIHEHILTNDEISEIKNKLELRDVNFAVSSELMENFQEEIKTRVLSSYEEFNKKIESITDKDILEILNNDLIINIGEIIDITDIDKITNYSDKVLTSVNDIMFMTLSDNFNKDENTFTSKNRLGKNISCGNRERLMSLISTGLTLSGIRNVISCDLNKVDNILSSIKLAASMNLANIYLFKHDKNYIENDGIIYPNLEQLDYLRNIKNVEVFRPNDMNEVIGTFKSIFNKNEGVSIVVLSQDEVSTKVGTSINDTSLGGYIIKEEEGIPFLNLISSGKDLDIALNLEQRLLTKGIFTRVISMPSVNRFDKQNDEYKNKIIDKNEKTFVLETTKGVNYSKYVTNNNYLLNTDLEEFNIENLERKIEDLI